MVSVRSVESKRFAIVYKLPYGINIIICAISDYHTYEVYQVRPALGWKIGTGATRDNSPAPDLIVNIWKNVG